MFIGTPTTREHRLAVRRPPPRPAPSYRSGAHWNSATRNLKSAAAPPPTAALWRQVLPRPLPQLAGGRVEWRKKPPYATRCVRPAYAGNRFPANSLAIHDLLYCVLIRLLSGVAPRDDIRRGTYQTGFPRMTTGIRLFH